MLIGICDNCNEERILRHVYDYWDVHVLDLCKYGCNDSRSKKMIKIRSRNFKVIDNLETLYVHSF